MVFNEKQKLLINSHRAKILCIAEPASGKTAVLTERIRHLIKDEKVEPKDIVAITFTKLAAREMRQRLEDLNVDEMFIGTVHSYALKICGLNEISMYQAIDEEEYDKILTTAAQLPRSKYTHIKHLLIDEAQDLTLLEYAFIDKIPTENIFYVADPNQCIYQFKGGSERFILEKYKDPSYTNFSLNINYRNAPNILKFANSLLHSSSSYGDEVVPIKTEDGVLETKMSFDEAYEELKDSKDWGNWAILARTNNEINIIQRTLDKDEIPNLTFKKSDFEDPTQIETALKSNVVKVLTAHTSKGLEFSNVIAVGIRVYNAAEANLAYVAATRAKNKLYWCKPIKGTRCRTRNAFSQPAVKGLKDDDGMIVF